MRNESYEAYRTMRSLEEASSSDLERDFMLLVLAVLALLAVGVALPALLVRRARARRVEFRSKEVGSRSREMLDGEFREVHVEGHDSADRAGRRSG